MHVVVPTNLWNASGILFNRFCMLLSNILETTRAFLSSAGRVLLLFSSICLLFVVIVVAVFFSR